QARAIKTAMAESKRSGTATRDATARGGRGQPSLRAATERARTHGGGRCRPVGWAEGTASAPKRQGSRQGSSRDGQAPDAPAGRKRHVAAGRDRPPRGAARRWLLELDGGAGALELCLRLLGVFLRHLLEHRLGGAVHQLLRLLE